MEVQVLFAAFETTAQSKDWAVVILSGEEDLKGQRSDPRPII
jgi:hypothetical protein